MSRAIGMHDPAQDWQDVEDLDGIDLNEGEGCPHCGGPASNLHEGPPAGYYHCDTCFAVWAGDIESASLVEEPIYGPVGAKDE
ncbi:hypothetical protein DEQ92_20355 [Haloferax sp. Atlit-6N]|uniref:hypothetical protein n=1 Tax=Haloferax sp. Atlit-6N TaxID=2077205 RepID=UPI000E2387DD|nr:hypothetical protein [Haloferax sp. Atlit-6N]REA00208.1 hypothetical protein DEQ92_20355 [Haloferax sp. Atlit-6N]